MAPRKNRTSHGTARRSRGPGRGHGHGHGRKNHGIITGLLKGAIEAGKFVGNLLEKPYFKMKPWQEEAHRKWALAMEQKRRDKLAKKQKKK